MDTIDGLAVRRLNETDLAAACGLNAEAGWNQVADDWREMLAFGHGTAVEDHDGKIVATSMVLPWSDRFAWIAMILVTASWRRRGIASALMRLAIDRCRDEGRIAGLDATEAGRPVYLPLGFEDVYTLSRWTAGRVDPKPERGAARVVAAGDIEAIAEFDAAIFGAERAHYLGHLQRRCPSLALQVKTGREIRGYVMARNGRLATQIGPLVAADDGTARILLGAALARVEGPVFLDGLDDHPWIREWLLTLGFERQRGYVRMLLGRSEPLDDPSRTFIISGPEFA